MAGIDCYGAGNGLVITDRASGPNTGDQLIRTFDGQWWLLVDNFSSYRNTGGRRGVVRGQFVFYT